MECLRGTVSNVVILLTVHSLLLLSNNNIPYYGLHILSTLSTTTTTIMVQAQPVQRPLPPPSNDNCTDAIPFTIGSTITLPNISLATKESNFTKNLCGATMMNSPGIWYTFVGTGQPLLYRGGGYDNDIVDYVEGFTVSVFTDGCSDENRRCKNDIYYVGYYTPVIVTVPETKYHVFIQNSPTLTIAPFLPLTNDNCINATPVTIGSPLYSDITNATALTSKNVNISCTVSEFTATKGVWFTFVGTGQDLVIRSCFVYQGMVIFSGGCPSRSSTCIKGISGNALTCDRLRFIISTTEGTMYHALVQLPNGTKGPIDFFIFPRPPVPNDQCVNAASLAIGSTVTVNTTYASVDFNLMTSGLCNNIARYYVDRPGVWYTFAGTGRNFFFRSCKDQSFYKDVIIFSGGCPPSVHQCVYASSTTCDRGRNIFETISGRTYYMLIRAREESINFSVVELDNAVVPQNDKCVNAAPFAIGSTLTVNTTCAREDPISITSGICSSIGSPNSNIPRIWYTFVGTGGHFLVRSCNHPYDIIIIFSGSCPPSAHQCVHVAADTCGRIRGIFETISGRTYYMVVQSREELINFSLVELDNTVVPQNDKCVNAAPFAIGSTITVNTTYASVDSNLMTSGACNYIANGRLGRPGVWYTFVGTGGKVYIDTCSSEIFIFSGGCPPGVHTCVYAATLDGCEPHNTFDTVLGTTYFMLVQSLQEFISISVRDFSTRIPSNDLCSNAQTLKINSTVELSTLFATRDLDTNDCGVGSEYSGVWFNFIGTGTRIGIKSCAVPFLQFGDISTISDVVYITIFIGRCGRDTLTCVTKTTTACSSQFNFNTVNGAIYYVFVQSAKFYPHYLTIFEPVYNDFCADAHNLNVSRPVLGNLTYASSEGNSGLPFCQGFVLQYPGVWFTLISPGGNIVIDPCLSFHNDSGVEVYVTVFAQSNAYYGQCDRNSLICLESARFVCGTVAFSFESIRSVQYRFVIQVPTMTSFWVNVSQQVLAVAPTPVASPIRPQPPQQTQPQPSKRKPQVTFIRGDPHIVTLDGLAFDCQARGEFILLKSLNSTMSIHGRFTKASTIGVGATASVSSGLVIRETDASLIQVSYDFKDSNSIEGCLNLVKMYENGFSRPVSNSKFTKVSVTLLNNEEIVIMYESGLEIHILVRSSNTWGCFFTHWIALPENYRSEETLTGLMGNANGNPYDDWQTNNGDILPTPETNFALFQGGYDYCRTNWCIRTASDSLFIHSNIESFTKYFECDEAYDGTLENAIKVASPELVQICGTSEECLIDGTVGTVSDAQRLLTEVILSEQILTERNVTYNFNTTVAPNNPSPPTVAPYYEPCGLFRRSIFCPFTLRGIIGRWFRKIFGLQ